MLRPSHRVGHHQDVRNMDGTNNVDRSKGLFELYYKKNKSQPGRSRDKGNRISEIFNEEDMVLEESDGSGGGMCEVEVEDDEHLDIVPGELNRRDGSHCSLYDGRTSKGPYGKYPASTAKSKACPSGVHCANYRHNYRTGQHLADMTQNSKVNDSCHDRQYSTLQPKTPKANNTTTGCRGNENTPNATSSLIEELDHSDTTTSSTSTSPSTSPPPPSFTTDEQSVVHHHHLQQQQDKTINSSLSNLCLSKSVSYTDCATSSRVQIGTHIPTEAEKAQFQRSLDSATTLVFHRRSGLPLTSSPVCKSNKSFLSIAGLCSVFNQKATIKSIVFNKVKYASE